MCDLEYETILQQMITEIQHKYPIDELFKDIMHKVMDLSVKELL